MLPAFRYTKHQVARGARADAESSSEILLIKNVSLLRATYQIRLLAFKAYETGKRLVVTMPKSGRIHSTLAELAERIPKTLRFSRF
jgi:hypothetical protein